MEKRKSLSRKESNFNHPTLGIDAIPDLKNAMNSLQVIIELVPN
jgi:hypothetical protein